MEQEKALKDADERAIRDGLDSGTFRNDIQSERAEITTRLLPMIERYRMRPTILYALKLVEASLLIEDQTNSCLA